MYVHKTFVIMIQIARVIWLSQKVKKRKERKKTTTTATSQKIDVYKQATIKSEMLGFTKSVVPIWLKILDHEDESNQQLLLKLHRINYLFNRLHG